MKLKGCAAKRRIVLWSPIALNVLSIPAVFAMCIWKFTDVCYAIQGVREGASYERNNWHESYTYRVCVLSDTGSCEVCPAGDGLIRCRLRSEFGPT